MELKRSMLTGAVVCNVAISNQSSALSKRTKQGTKKMVPYPIVFFFSFSLPVSTYIFFIKGNFFFFFGGWVKELF